MNEQATDQTTPASIMEVQEAGTPEAPPEHLALIKKWCERIAAAKKFHEPAFKRMREDQKFAANINGDQWDGNTDKYVANLVLRHVRNKVGALYAKNPRVKAQRADRIEYTIWDGKIETLNAAIAIAQAAAQAQAVATGVAPPPAPTVDNATGAVVPPPPPPDPVQAAFAQELIQDAVAGFQRKQLFDKIGKTLEIVFHHQLREQNPTFKKEMKQVVRRVVTCGVGYAKMGFQRDLGRDPNTIKRLTDSTQQLAVIEAELARAQDYYEAAECEAKKAELTNAMAALEATKEIIIREGLMFSYPLADQVIIDPRCRQLTGLVGANWLAVEHMMTKDEVQEVFKIDLGKNFRGYIQVPSNARGGESQATYTARSGDAAEDDFACIWEVQDRRTKTVFWVCEGYDDYLRQPAPPTVDREQFFDIDALVFNEVENQFDLYPPSDVRLLMHQQREHNRSREALRNHRIAAAPRWAHIVPLDEKVRERIKQAVPFDNLDLASSLPPGTKIADVFGPVQMPGVDPNLYDSTPVWEDFNKVAAASDANFAVTSGGTATESTIAEGARVSSIDDNKDDLDEFLTTIARDGGQVLLRELSKETVVKIVGPGAAWPELPNDEIRDELYLEVLASSSGRPNRAIDVANFERLAPLLIQTPGIKPEFLARHAIRVLDDRLDVDEAIAENLPSITALNSLAGKPAAAQPGTGDPATDPASQGPAGGNQMAANPAGAQPPPEGMMPAG